MNILFHKAPYVLSAIPTLRGISTLIDTNVSASQNILHVIDGGDRKSSRKMEACWRTGRAANRYMQAGQLADQKTDRDRLDSE
jgi:hypothetical protein